MIFILVSHGLNAPNGNIRQKLEEIFKLMLVVWCRQSQANKLMALEPGGKIFYDIFLVSLTIFLKILI